MKKFEKLEDQALYEVSGGGLGKTLGGWAYTLLGEVDDFKAGLKAGLKYHG